MATGDILTIEEIKNKHNKVTGNLVGNVVSPTQALQQSQTQQTTRGNQFETKPQGFLGKTGSFLSGLVGGKKLAEGAGKSLAAPGIQEQLSEADLAASEIALNLQKRISKLKDDGQDTSKLEEALFTLRQSQEVNQDAQRDFVDDLPSNREVIGSATQLAGTLVAPTIAGKATKSFALGKPLTRGGAILKGTKIGAIAGGIEGTIQGLGRGIEEEGGVGDVAKSTVAGTVTGATLGGVIGGIGGAIVGGKGVDKTQRVLDDITPETSQLSPKQYEEALKRGLVTPKTSTSPSKYILPENQRTVALKYSEIVDKDPVNTSIKISNKIGELDDRVGGWLADNNGIYSKGELKNFIVKEMSDISDVTVDEQLLLRKKAKIINNFVADVSKNDMHTLWEARKAFDLDQSIDKAFSGSPSLQKNIKVGLRNAVQNFISDRTPDSVYRGYMTDMSDLFRLRDTVMIRASKERALSGIAKWIRNNPKKYSAVKWTSIGVLGGALGGSFFGRDSAD